MDKNEQLTSAICEEEWEVDTGKKVFTLTAKQVEALRELTKNGNRNIVWFKDFGISVAHIISISLKRREYFKIQGGIQYKIGRSEYEQIGGRLLE